MQFGRGPDAFRAVTFGMPMKSNNNVCDVVLMPRLEEELPTLDTPAGKKVFAAGFFGFILAGSLVVGAMIAGSELLRDDGASKFDDIKVTSRVKKSMPAAPVETTAAETGAQNPGQ